MSSHSKNWRTPAWSCCSRHHPHRRPRHPPHLRAVLQPMTAISAGTARPSPSRWRCRTSSSDCPALSGAIADRFGTARVMIFGSLLYAAGLWMMSHATTGTEFSLSAGLMVGVALSCTNSRSSSAWWAAAFPRTAAPSRWHRQRGRIVRAVHHAPLRPGAHQPHRLARGLRDPGPHGPHHHPAVLRHGRDRQKIAASEPRMSSASRSGRRWGTRLHPAVLRVLRLRLPAAVRVDPLSRLPHRPEDVAEVGMGRTRADRAVHIFGSYLWASRAGATPRSTCCRCSTSCAPS